MLLGSLSYFKVKESKAPALRQMWESQLRGDTGTLKYAIRYV